MSLVSEKNELKVSSPLLSTAFSIVSVSEKNELKDKAKDTADLSVCLPVSEKNELKVLYYLWEQAGRRKPYQKRMN